jgi:uncharacterized membrane protein
VVLLVLCFLLGCVVGLRSLTPPAIICWGAHLGWLHFADTKLAFINHPATLIIFTLLALVELVTDKLPKTPARTAPPGLIARIVLGAACGAAVSVSAGGGLVVASMAGVIGALAGTFIGYHVRHALVTRANQPDFAVALAEDLVAIISGFVIISHL